MFPFEEHIRFDGGIELGVLAAERVYLHAVEHILRLVLPFHLRIGARYP